MCNCKYTKSLLIGYALLMAIACSMLTGCGGAGSGAGIKNPFSGGTIAGIVTDVDGLKLQGVRVTAGGVETFTDVDGNFTLNQVPAGAQTVAAAFSGYFDTGVGNKFIQVSDGKTYSAGTLVLARLAGSSVLLSQLKPQSSDYTVQSVSMNKVIYTHGLARKTPGGGAPFISPTTAVYLIDKHYARFKSVIGGLDNKTSTLEMVFRVYGDGTLLYTSANLKPGLIENLDIDVSGVTSLKLEVSTVKPYFVTSDYAWGDPTLTVKSKP